MIIKKFLGKEAELRVLISENKFYIFADDVAKIVKARNTYTILRNLKDYEKAFFLQSDIDEETADKDKKVPMLTEAGMFAILCRSRQDSVAEVNRWYAEKLSPLLHKHMAMSSLPLDELIEDKMFIKSILEALYSSMDLHKDDSVVKPEFNAKVTIKEFSTMLTIKGLTQSAIRETMADGGMIFRGKNGEWKPYEYYTAHGYIYSNFLNIDMQKGRRKPYLQLMLTPKGVIKVCSKLINKYGIDFVKDLPKEYIEVAKYNYSMPGAKKIHSAYSAFKDVGN